jgi:chromate transporter
MDGLRPIVVALIFVGGIRVMRNALFIGGVLALGSLDWLSAGLFVATILILRKWKPNPVVVILGGGVAGGIIRLLLKL